MTWNSIYYFVMIPMVYASFMVLIAGLIFKLLIIFFSGKFSGRLGIYPSVLPRYIGVIKDAFFSPAVWKKDKILWIFILFFHAAFLLLFIGHVELIRNFSIFQIIPHKVFPGAGAVGIILIISVLYFLLRRFRSPWREISIPEDYLLLLLLLITIVIGSHLHLAARYGVAGFDIPPEEYGKYLESLIYLKPAVPDGISGSPHYVLVVLHIFFANIVLILIPFSKIIHMIFIFPSLALKREKTGKKNQESENG